MRVWIDCSVVSASRIATFSSARFFGSSVVSL
jgi:hypothetical protein